MFILLVIYYYYRGLHVVQPEIYGPCDDDRSRKTMHKEKLEQCVLIALIYSQVSLTCP